MSASEETPLEISPTEVSKLLAETATRPRLVDCREEDEWQICHIDGAELVPLSRFDELARQRFTDPTEQVIVYCHHGVRSLRATRFLRQLGLTRVQSMSGGIEGWADDVDPNMPRY